MKYFFRLLSKTFTDKLTETVAAFNEKNAKLQQQLESKDQLNKKWSTESKAIVENFEKLVVQLKKELNKSKKENNKLNMQLEYEQKKFLQYKSFLEVITKDVDKISKKAEENVESLLLDPKVTVM